MRADLLDVEDWPSLAVGSRGWWLGLVGAVGVVRLDGVHVDRQVCVAVGWNFIADILSLLLFFTPPALTVALVRIIVVSFIVMPRSLK